MNKKSFHPSFKVIASVILAILLIIGAIFLKEHNNLPHSFTIQLGGIDASAAGVRSFKWELVFEDDNLVSAIENYDIGTRSTTANGQCILKDQKLVDVATGRDCPYQNFFNIPLTRDGIKNKINNKEFKIGNPEDCGANEPICYKIIR